MKLLHCYIENFGGLSQYSLDFTSGLTTICADNGFGKTTLAVFLRTMFYGFPRAGKALDKNDRKKYLPWQGGKFGGNLTFEHEGSEYRIERTFGATPRSDTFALYELNPLRKSTRFSENIGLELFGLDFESFERSTYLPQNRNFSSLTTDSIQAKLGDLVEDTSDIGNFDKAMQTLRSKRSSYVPYRGNGGLVNEAVGEISRLQTELDDAVTQRAALEEAQTTVMRLQAEYDVAQTELASVSKQITAASQEAAKQTLRQQYAALLRQQEEWQLRETALRRKYLDGLPSEEAMQEISALLDRLAVLQGGRTETDAEKQAADRVQRDRQRFSRGIPTETEFSTCESKCRDVISLRGALQQSSFAEQTQLDELESFFAPGIPEPETMDIWQADLETKARLQAQLEAAKLPSEEEAALQQKQEFFAAGVPDDQLLQARQADLSRIAHLRQEAAQLDAQLQSVPKQKSASAFPALVGGGVLLIIGIVLLIVQMVIPGAIALGLGVLLLIVGVYFQLHRVLTSELHNQTGLQSRLDATQQELARLHRELTTFLSRYPMDAADPQTAIETIRRQAAEYLSLRQRADAMNIRRKKLYAQIAAIASRLEQALKPYFLNRNAIPLAEFRAKREQLLYLRQQKSESDSHQNALRQEIAILENEISAFLLPYCDLDRPAAELLTELRRDADAYRQAEELLIAKSSLNQAQSAEQNSIKSRLRNFFEGCGLETADRNALQTLRDDKATLYTLQNQQTALTEQITQFYTEHAADLQAPVSEAADLEMLEEAEDRLRDKLNHLSRQLAESRQSVRQLRHAVDQIPVKEDALSHRQEEKQQYLRNSALLDSTMDFLQQAREQLSSRYMAPIQRSFVTYMEQLWGDDVGRLLLDTELNVSLERCGEARELVYFSAGSADIVTLCMRLSLVDALFGDTQPVLILDDPFVNLDNRHTEAALNLLKKLAERHQILYLTCNSSRVPEQAT